MNSGKYLNILRVGGEARCPSYRLQHVPVKVGVAAVANPSGDWQHKFDASLITLFHQIEVVRPVVIPPLLHLGHGHAAGAIGGKRSEFELIFVEHRCRSFVHERSSLANGC